MISNETKKMNQKYVKFQSNFNKGWSIGYATVIFIGILLVLAIHFLTSNLWVL